MKSKKIAWLLVFIVWVFFAPLLALSASAQETQSPPAAGPTVSPSVPAPVPAPGAPAAPAAPPKVDKGDNAWMLTSSALVLMMTIPGLFLFYGGLVRSKNVLGTIMHSFIMVGSSASNGCSGAIPSPLGLTLAECSVASLGSV